MQLKIFFLWLGLSLIGCKPASKPDIHFYHWKGVFQTDSLEQSFLKNTNSKKLYLRFFDVDFHADQGAVPIGITQISEKDTYPFDKIIATIFITNRTMVRISSDKIPDLAQKITKKIFSQGKNLPIKGIQLDCDWSEQSQTKYFKLCSEIRKICKSKNIELSATIRLHQYKYASQTGIPPIDRGVLMLYNVGDIDGRNTQNSILDLKTVSSYLSDTKSYPLHLDVALPIFSWAVVQRMGKTVNLLSQIDFNELEGNNRIKKIQKNLYKITENHYFGGVYLYEGDFLRWESVSIELLESLCQIISKHIETKEVIFYHLENKILQHYEIQKLTNLVNYWL
ncbi:MAG: hypothetical protein MUC49_01155 [Raineya sp.]|jgi:hypothetical protein|nr:hypothetical protein [Raineya sp.]